MSCGSPGASPQTCLGAARLGGLDPGGALAVDVPGQAIPQLGRALELTLNNENTLDYVLRGREIPGGWVWERLARSHGGAARSGDKTKTDRTAA